MNRPDTSPPAFRPWLRRFAVYGPTLVVIGVVVLVLATLQNGAESTRRVAQTYDRIALLHQVRTRLVDAETGQRGYLITGDERYLDPFYDAERDAHVALAALQRAHARNPARLAGVRHLDSLVDRRFAIMARPIQAYARGPDAAREQLIAGRGREAMAELRTAIGELESLELARLDADRAAQQRAGWLVLGALLLGAALIVAAARLTHHQLERYAAQLELLHADEQELNARLQEQALELEVQAAELQTSNDELIEQQAAVETMAAELEASNEELQVTNAQLEERTDAAEAANRTKAQFLASMSHELRTPLNAIGGYVDLLELGVHGAITEAQRADLERIRHNSSHLLLLISDILNFAKIQAGRLHMDSSDLPVPQLVSELEALVRPLVDARSITFVSEQPEPVQARGDADRVRQILLNLLSNAVKFTEPGGTVLLKSRAHHESVHIDVCDTGVGIAPELHEAIFDPFVQVHRGAGGALRDGVGLGLSISRELAHAMGGDISVQSAPGQGAIFTLTLPRGDAPVRPRMFASEPPQA